MTNTTMATPSQSKPQRAASPDWPKGALPEHWIDSLLMKFEVYYGEKFHRQWANVPRDAMRKQWAIDLGQLKPEELRAGVEALKRAEWPPTLPEFIALCCPPMNVDAALYEAVEQIRKRREGKDVWSKPEIYWAAIKIGEFDLLNVPHGQLVKRFRDALEEVSKGPVDPVPPRLDALPAPGKAVASREKVEQEIAKVRATKKHDGSRDWAKRIVQRAEKGEKIPYMVLKMAQTALGAAPYKGD